MSDTKQIGFGFVVWFGIAIVCLTCVVGIVAWRIGYDEGVTYGASTAHEVMYQDIVNHGCGNYVVGRDERGYPKALFQWKEKP